jgi:hypothetical protein
MHGVALSIVMGPEVQPLTCLGPIHADHTSSFRTRFGDLHLYVSASGQCAVHFQLKFDLNLPTNQCTPQILLGNHNLAPWEISLRRAWHHGKYLSGGLGTQTTFIENNFFHSRRTKIIK